MMLCNYIYRNIIAICKKLYQLSIIKCINIYINKYKKTKMYIEQNFYTLDRESNSVFALVNGLAITSKTVKTVTNKSMYIMIFITANLYEELIQNF